MPEEIYDFMMDVNAKGTFLVDQAVLRVMIPNKSGKIVNMFLHVRQGGLSH